MNYKLIVAAVLVGVVAASSTAVAQPSPPRDLEASAGDAVVNLEWSGSLEGDIVNYRVFKGTNPSRKVEVASTGGELEYRDTNVENGVTYYYHVVALGREGDSAPSNQVNATPRSPRTPPSVPVNFRITGDATNVVAHLNWREPRRDGGDEVEEYRVYRGTSPRSDSPLTRVSVSSYSDTDISRNEVYYYRVTALNRYGESESTEKHIFTLSGEPTPPWAPNNLRASRSGNEVRLVWEEPRSGGEPITRYRIYRSDDGSTSYLETTSRLTYTDSSLEAGRNYTYRVSAVNSVGEGLLSSDATVRVPAERASPGAPSEPPAVQVGETGDGAALSWSPPRDTGGAEVTEYRVYRESGGEAQQIASVQDTNYTDTEVEPGVTYNYSVSAVNDAGEGPRSQQVTYTASSDVGDTDNVGGDDTQLPGFTAFAALVALVAAVLAGTWRSG